MKINSILKFKLFSFFTLGVLAGSTFLVNNVWAASKNPSCAQALTRLQELSKENRHDDISPKDLRDGLFTVAVLDSPLLTSRPFVTILDQELELMRATPTPADWGAAKLKNLEADLVTAKERYEYYKEYSDSYPSTFKDTKDKIKAVKTEIKDFKKLQQYNLADRKKILKADLPAFAKLPTETQYWYATRIWRSLVTFYDFGKAPTELTLSETDKFTSRAKANDLTFGQMVNLNKITKDIDNDEILKTSMLELIADFVGRRQEKTSFFKKHIVLKEDVAAAWEQDRRELYALPQIQIDDMDTHGNIRYQRMSIDEKLKSDQRSDTLTHLLTEETPLLFNERYFKSFARVFDGHTFKAEEFVENFATYSEVMKKELAKSIWNQLEIFYGAHEVVELSAYQAAQVVEKIKNDGLSTDEYMSNASWIRAINKNASVKDRTLALIEDNFINSAELIPHLKNAEKWKNRKIGEVLVAPATIFATGYAGMLGTLGHIVAHTPHIALTPGILELGGGALAAGGLTTLAYKGYFKARSYFARKKLNKNLEKHDVSTQDSASESE